MIYILLLLSISSETFAQEIYRFGPTKVIFHHQNGLLVNKSCTNDKCEALKLGKEYEKNQVPPSLLIGGKNPGSVKCKEILKGKVVIGKDRKGHEQSFCFFKDESFLQN